MVFSQLINNDPTMIEYFSKYKKFYSFISIIGKATAVIQRKPDNDVRDE